MKVPAVFYSDKLNCCVIVRGKSVDKETGEDCVPVEWYANDMYKARELFGWEPHVDAFILGEFIHIGEL